VSTLPYIADAVEALRALAISACIFGLIELLRPVVRPSFFRISIDRDVYAGRRAAGDGYGRALKSAARVGEGLTTDLIHKLVNPPVIGAVVALLSAVLIMVLEASGDPRSVLEPYLAEWPVWLLVLVGTVITDFAGYWRHRLFHTSALWPVHAVHHSSPHLDWLSTTRFHPINQTVTNLVHIGLLWMLGFPALAIGGTTALRGMYGTFVHANLDISYGPLDYLFVSPRFHRWHHSSEEEAIDKNFATFFSAFDWMFGTAYLPNRPSHMSGLHGDKLQESYLAQLGHPFEVWSRAREATVPKASTESNSHNG
jgi:sterol desaturase/sphingolipid hydroxylase (fatty acid hydroxylase superfamily)